jgi:hypothetical protein
VTLKDSLGVVKSSQMTWPGGDLRYQVNLTATIKAGDTVEVTAGGTTTVIFVDPLTGQLDPVNDRITGTGPANQTLAIELSDPMWRTYTATAQVNAAGWFTVSVLYRDGISQTVDIQPGHLGTSHYTHEDGNQVYVQFGQVVIVNENYNRVSGYAGVQSVPVSVTLYAPGGSVKATCGTTSNSYGAGSYEVSFYTLGCWGGGDPIIIRGGDTVVVTVEGVSTTVPVPLLTATPNLATDTVSGVGPTTSALKVTLDGCGGMYTASGCPQWVTTDGAGNYTAGPFLYQVWGMTGTITQTYDMVVGNTGRVEFTNLDFNLVFINYAATGVATTIAAGGVRAGATSVMGMAVPGATVEIWDVTANALIGTGTAGNDARFAISVPALIYGHTIVAIANGLPSVGHVVERAVTLNGPTVSVTNTVGFYGIAPANATIEIYEGSLVTAIVTTTTSPSGHWSAIAILANGTHTITAKAVEPNQFSDSIVVIVDPTAVSIGGSSGTVGGQTQQSDPSGQNHFQVTGGVRPITITVEVLNNPCTVTMSFMGQTITVTEGITPSEQTIYTAVFTNYTWSWGTHDVVVNAISCGGTSVSQPVAQVTLIDPSGYVYNAITGARIQGATVTCYYSDTIQQQWVIWEAALYNNQLNSQSTDEQGKYGFMVPAGQYYVTASKPGYQNNQTIVYDIPPEVTDANIPLMPLDEPITGLTVTSDSPTMLGQLTTLTANVVSGTNVSYAWALGDGAPGSGAVVTHTYPAVNVYTAIVTATNNISVVIGTTTVTVTINTNTYTITPTAGVGGVITPNTPQTVNYGASQMFTITPNIGYHITDVGVDGASIGVESAYTFTNVTANHTITAAFAVNAPTLYTLTVMLAGNGRGRVDSFPSGLTCTSESCAATFAAGSTVTLTATPLTTTAFLGWSGAVVTTTNPLVLTMDATKQITATFHSYEVFLPLIIRSGP